MLVGAKVNISGDSLLWSWSVNPLGQALRVTEWHTTIVDAVKKVSHKVHLRSSEVSNEA